MATDDITITDTVVEERDAPINKTKTADQRASQRTYYNTQKDRNYGYTTRDTGYTDIVRAPLRGATRGIADLIDFVPNFFGQLFNPFDKEIEALDYKEPRGLIDIFDYGVKAQALEQELAEAGYNYDDLTIEQKVKVQDHFKNNYVSDYTYIQNYHPILGSSALSFMTEPLRDLAEAEFMKPNIESFGYDSKNPSAGFHIHTGLEDFGIGPYAPVEVLEGLGYFASDMLGLGKAKKGYDAMRAAGMNIPEAKYPLGATVGGGTLMDLFERIDRDKEEEELETIYVD